MPGCVLRVELPISDLDKFLLDSGWKSEARWSDGFNVLISEDEQFENQLADAVRFVADNRSTLKILRSKTDGSAAELDFGVFVPDGPTSSVIVPADAMHTFSEAGLCLRVSTYVPSAS